MNENTRCHGCGHKANVHERGTVCLASRCQCTKLVPTWTLEQVIEAAFRSLGCGMGDLALLKSHLEASNG